jgi:hypothetical protein
MVGSPVNLKRHTLLSESSLSYALWALFHTENRILSRVIGSRVADRLCETPQAYQKLAQGRYTSFTRMDGAVKNILNRRRRILFATLNQTRAPISLPQ